MSQQLPSHGRGGAGNMVDASQSPRLQPSDLETPTLKTPIVTTGRGGTGNMAKNTDPAETRSRQDIGGVPRGPGHGAQHAGRGGAGNFLKDGDREGLEKRSEEGEVDENAETADAAEFSKKKINAGKDEGLVDKLKSGLFGQKGIMSRDVVAQIDV